MNPAWALLRLASPQLPIGGYSYSQGLEMAVENGRVADPTTAARWIRDQLLLNLARFEAPLLLAHCQAAADQDWNALQRLCDEHRASRETRELHQESRQMGYSLQQLLTGLPELDEPAREFLAQQAEPHLALGWALAAVGVATLVAVVSVPMDVVQQLLKFQQAQNMRVILIFGATI